jgi:hypothetical protein
MSTTRASVWVLLLAFLAAAAPIDPAFAYVGPGAGIGVIGTLIAFFGAVLLAIVGFVWYPIKRLLRKRKTAAAKTEAAVAAPARKSVEGPIGDGEGAPTPR